MGNEEGCIKDRSQLNNCLDNGCYDADGNPISVSSPPSNDDSSHDNSTQSSLDENSNFLLKILPWSWIPILLLLTILFLIQIMKKGFNKPKSGELDRVFDTMYFLPSEGNKELEKTFKPKKSKKKPIKIKKDRGSKSKKKKDSDDDITFKSYI